MKKILSILILLFISESIQAKSAEEFYYEMQYDSAIQSYLQVIEKDQYSAIAFYNLGNCYLRKGDTINALYYYYRSYHFNPNDPSCEYNIDLLEQKLGLENHFLDTGISGWYKKTTLRFGINTWTFLSILLINLIFGIFIFYHLKKKRIRTSIRLLLLGGIFIGLLLYIVAAEHYYSSLNSGKVMTTSTQIELRSEPSTNSTSLSNFKAGTIFSIIDENSEWIRVRTNDNIEGWVIKKEIKKI